MSRTLPAVAVLFAVFAATASAQLDCCKVAEPPRPLEIWAWTHQGPSGAWSLPQVPERGRCGNCGGDRADPTASDGAAATDIAAHACDHVSVAELATDAEVVATTALFGLGLVAQGITPTRGREPSRQCLSRALDFQLAIQGEQTGRIGAGDDDFAHAVATLGLALLSPECDDERLEHAAQRAVTHLAERQLSRPHGWTSRHSGHTLAWGFWALVTARRAELHVDPRALDRGRTAVREQLEEVLGGDVPRDDPRLYSSVAALTRDDEAWLESDLAARAMAAMGAGPSQALWPPGEGGLGSEALFWSMLGMFDIGSTKAGSRTWRAFEERFQVEALKAQDEAMTAAFGGLGDRLADKPQLPKVGWTSARGFCFESLATMVYYRYDLFID